MILVAVTIAVGPADAGAIAAKDNGQSRGKANAKGKCHPIGAQRVHKIEQCFHAAVMTKV